MIEFYKQLTMGKDKDVALAVAMRATRTDHPHPYHWCPFALVGDPIRRDKAGATDAQADRGPEGIRRTSVFKPTAPASRLPESSGL